MYQIGVFISHSWTYSGHYETLASWIFQERYTLHNLPLIFSDLSIPKHNPIHNAPNAQSLQIAINAEISRSHVVVIPTGMYANYSNWIQKEIDGSKIHRRPILAVNPWGQERKSSVVASSAQDMVGWTKLSVINGILNLYRGQYVR